MSGGGLISLVSFGNENVVVNGNPQITWFYKAFMRYTHFSQEPVQIPLQGPTQLFLDTPILLKAQIPRVGDLLSDLVFRCDLPDIYSKAYISGTTLLRQPQEFQWVRQIGVRIIERITFLVGGTKVQEYDSDWIAAKALLDKDQTEYQKWRYMVGDVPELFDPANGIYADPAGGYPSVVAWTTQTTQQNAPSIRGRTLRIPLGLWFSDFIANSLPIVALQQHIPEIQIQLRSIRELYTILDPNGVRVRYGQQLLPYLPSDQYTQVWNPTLLGPLPVTLNNRYGSYTDPSGAPRYFFTDINTTVPNSDGWPLNPTLEGIYSFVTEEEQKKFVTQTLRYTVRQIRQFQFPGVTARDRYKLDVHNICSRILWYARRSDAIPNRNDYTNLTNWIFTNQRPYIIPLAGYPAHTVTSRSGLTIPGIQRGILRNALITANGNNLFNSEDANFFNQYVPYAYLKGNSAPFSNYGLDTQNEMWPLHIYSFALDGSAADQPSGTLNMSRINDVRLDLDVEPIPVGAFYTYTVYIAVETVNFLEVSSGLAGMKFAL